MKDWTFLFLALFRSIRVSWHIWKGFVFNFMTIYRLMNVNWEKFLIKNANFCISVFASRFRCYFLLLLSYLDEFNVHSEKTTSICNKRYGRCTKTKRKTIFGPMWCCLWTRREKEANEKFNFCLLQLLTSEIITSVL